ncbi:MAG: enoyl-CoA hydratase/isomerase family protein [Actinomycetota bacterium]|nr:enoyl-CoA hydratase/isomerase family protein [Acidimicrobiales bacterium]
MKAMRENEIVGNEMPTLRVDGSRARIRLRRPEKRNRVEPKDLEALVNFVQEIHANSSIRCVTIEATGPSWCSGYHLGALAARDKHKYGFNEGCDAIASIKVPTVAVIGGNIHGGGTDLAMACDMRIASSSIMLAMPAAKIGLQYYATGLQRFVERIGPSATKRIFLTGESIQADELLTMGYLTEILDQDMLEPRASEICQAISILAPNAVKMTKKAIDDLAGLNPDLDQIQSNHLASARSQDHLEAMKALREKRKPNFEGS